MLDLLNRAVARELQVSIQYLWQHILSRGVKGWVVREELKKIGIAEMRHAEAIAERMHYLGGTPTPKPEPIFVGESLKEMFLQDQKDEREAIELYKQVIERARLDGDEATQELFLRILGEEESHDDFFTTVLEEI